MTDAHPPTVRLDSPADRLRVQAEHHRSEETRTQIRRAAPIGLAALALALFGCGGGSNRAVQGSGNATGLAPAAVSQWTCADFATRSKADVDAAYVALLARALKDPVLGQARNNNLDESVMAQQLRLAVEDICAHQPGHYFPTAGAIARLVQVAENQLPPLESRSPSSGGGTGSAGTGGGSPAQGSQPSGHLPVCDPNTPMPPCVTTDSAGNITYTYEPGGTPPSSAQLQGGGSTPTAGSAGASGAGGSQSGNGGSQSGNGGSQSGPSGSTRTDTNATNTTGTGTTGAP